MTLIELVIVVAIMAILMMAAIPSYRSYVLRVHRGEAVNMLLQAAMCQERIHATSGSYDTGLCPSTTEQNRYKLQYQPTKTRGQSYTIIAVPQGEQRTDLCGSLSLDQSGDRKASASTRSVMQCWSAR